MLKTNQQLMSIGRIARATGVAATALRFYEREGVLSPTRRTGAGYRLYDRRALEQLEFIRSAQAVGFTLDDIRTLLRFDGGQERAFRKDVQGLIEARLGELEQKMRDLTRVRATLARALKKCRHSDGECPVLQELHVPEAIQRVRKAKHGAKRAHAS